MTPLTLLLAVLGWVALSFCAALAIGHIFKI